MERVDMHSALIDEPERLVSMSPGMLCLALVTPWRRARLQRQFDTTREKELGRRANGEPPHPILVFVGDARWSWLDVDDTSLEAALSRAN